MNQILSTEYYLGHVLLKGIEPGNKVRFTIDANKRAIVDVVPLDR